MPWPKLDWETQPTGPLKGIRVVDMSTVVLGPLATLMMADMGAEVIKIENRQGNTPGDMMRYAGWSPTGDLGPIFSALNRNKKGLELNVKDEEGKRLLTDLIRDADVFFHNVRMAGMERLGFDYEAVKAINPRIVYVHCAGFGAGGPHEHRQAYDDLIQGASGFASLFEERDGGRPAYAPSLLADKTVGLFASNATLAALLHRERTGEGQFVQVPMFESFTWFNMAENLYGATFDEGDGKLGYTRSINPRRRPYPTADGFIGIMPYSDKQWATFFELGGRPGTMEDERFATYPRRTEHTAELYSLIEEVAASKTTDEWMTVLDENNIPAMRYNRMADVLEEEHLAATGFFERREGEHMGRYRSMRHPVSFSATPANTYGDPPRLGQHDTEIKKGE
ncbi:CaiB/BaiF CoA transferase family protein [Novosphingopyxis iocasae]|uniref:CaiB/BaiF CoA transferase family protein n=1 Tax=Novosphingopyxis iocasae TaxID=2762729 RepID=UPI001651556C|nr:CoA transferase [Novosphingopyxis iocasae]